MKRVYFQPIGEVNQRYEQCVNAPIDVKELEGMVDEATYKELVKAAKSHTINLWGVAPGKDEHAKEVWESMDINDWVIFTSQKKVWSAGTIFTTAVSDKISEKFLLEKGYEYIYFVLDRKNIDIPTEDLVKTLGLTTSKIDSTFIVRRFDGLGLSKNEEIVKTDGIDNDKIVKFLEEAEAKATLSDVKPNAAKKPAAKKATTTTKKPAPKAEAKPAPKKPAPKAEVKKETVKKTAAPKKPAAKKAPVKKAAPKTNESKDHSKNLTLINHRIIKKLAMKQKPAKRNVKQQQAKAWYINKLIFKG